MALLLLGRDGVDGLVAIRSGMSVENGGGVEC